MPVGAGWLSVQSTGVGRGSMGTCRLVDSFVPVGMFWQIQSYKYSLKTSNIKSAESFLFRFSFYLLPLSTASLFFFP